MLATTANLMAFYLGSVFFERLGVLSGVMVFLVTALVGTIMASMVEEYLRILLSVRSKSVGRSKVTAQSP